MSKPSMRALRLTASAVLLFAAGSSFAQWQWIDTNGSRVYSDRPPPAHIPAKNIVKRPSSTVTISRTASRPAETAADGASAAKAAAAPAKQNGASDPKAAAEQKKKQEENAAKAKAEEEKIAKARAENCERAKSSLATLNSGVRVGRTNAKGEREILDDKARAEERKRAEDVVASECGPMPTAPGAASRQAQ